MEMAGGAQQRQLFAHMEHKDTQSADLLQKIWSSEDYENVSTGELRQRQADLAEERQSGPDVGLENAEQLPRG
eukprot:12887872-Prorocentrum_lima.AAC.1